MKIRKVLYISLAVIFAAVSASGAFFMRVRSSALQAMKSSGGKVLTQSDAMVNGRDCKLTVIGFEKSISEAANDIGRLMKIPKGAAELPIYIDGTWLTSEEDGVRRDVMFFPGKYSDSCTAWLVESDASARDMPLSSVPGGDPFPAADLISCIHIKSSGTVLTVHESAGAIPTCARAVENTMTSLGWEVLLSNDSTSYFAKGGNAAVALSYASHGGVRTIVVRRNDAK